jgi:RNA polymerase sigma-70 factor (ECF subfamily)
MRIEAISGANTTSSSANRVVAEEDASLVAAAKATDTRAFELLVEQNERKIFSMAHRITRNREDAEDVVQQSFQKAFINLKKFEGDSLFSTWLTRIAINEALMLLRRKRGSREVPIAESTSKDEAVLPLDFPDSGPNPEDSYLDREQEQVLSAALNKLRPGIRKAIELRDLGELSTGETALVMGLSVSAVKGRVFHGRRKLRETLKQSPKVDRRDHK